VRAVVAAPAVEVDAAWTLPAHPDVIQLYAEGLARSRNYDPVGARERLAEVTRRDPTFCRGQLMLGRVLEILGAEERVTVARIARDLAATLPPAARHAAVTESFSIEREWASCAEAATAWLAHSPDNLDAAIMIAKSHAWAKKPDEAARALAHARTLARCEEDLIQVDLAAYRVAERRRDFASAHASAEAATTRARALGATLHVAFARRCEAWALLSENELEAGVAAAGEAKALDVAMGNRAGALVSLNLLGGSLMTLGHLTSAKAAFEEATADHEVLGGQLRLPVTLSNLGESQLALGDLAGARASLDRALTFYPPDPRGDAYSDNYLGLQVLLVELDLRAGRLDAADARLAGIPALEDPYQRLRRATVAARVSHARDQLDAARRLLEDAIKLELPEEDRVEVRVFLARVLVDAGAGAKALPHLDAAIGALTHAQERDKLALAEGLRAESLRAAGRAADAVEAEARLVARAKDSEHVDVLTAAAIARARAGDLAPARALLPDARSRGDVTRALRIAVAVEPDDDAVAEAERLGLALYARQLRDAARP
jgi:tetratricopeptide (TPR) repeat protein